jgi:hypothetical protein
MKVCGKCGSEKVIPDVPLLDAYGDWGAVTKKAGLAVHGTPEAWFFKETAAGHLHGAVCGECGYVEFRVDNFRELYARYMQSRGFGGA